MADITRAEVEAHPLWGLWLSDEGERDDGHSDSSHIAHDIIAATIRTERDLAAAREEVARLKAEQADRLATDDDHADAYSVLCGDAEWTPGALYRAAVAVAAMAQRNDESARALARAVAEDAFREGLSVAPGGDEYAIGERQIAALWENSDARKALGEVG